VEQRITYKLAVLTYKSKRSFSTAAPSVWNSLPVSVQNCDTLSFNDPLSGTTQVSLYQKDKTNLDFTEARDSE